MCGDLRRTFVGWLKKTEASLQRQKDELSRDKEHFEEEKSRILKAIQAEKEREAAKIREDRKKMEHEHDEQLKQVGREREDARRKIETERARIEQDKEAARRPPREELVTQYRIHFGQNGCSPCENV